jgi:hypothetical protein
MDNTGGARRGKFSPNENANDEEYEIKSGKRGATTGATRGPRRKEPGGLWPEITKNFVVQEAIERQGYDVEGKDDFYCDKSNFEICKLCSPISGICIYANLFTVRRVAISWPLGRYQEGQAK